MRTRNGRGVSPVVTVQPVPVMPSTMPDWASKDGHGTGRIGHGRRRGESTSGRSLRCAGERRTPHDGHHQGGHEPRAEAHTSCRHPAVPPVEEPKTAHPRPAPVAGL